MSNRVGLRLGSQSRLVCLVLVHVLVVTRVEGVGSSRTRRLCLGLGDILL
jgi:hypothetical protein